MDLIMVFLLLAIIFLVYLLIHWCQKQLEIEE